MKKHLTILTLVLTFVLFNNNVSADSSYVKRDSLGRVIEEREYYSNKKIKEIEKYTYYKNTDEVLTERTYKYYSNGKKSYYKYEKNKIVWDHYDNEYDEQDYSKLIYRYTSKGIKKNAEKISYKNNKISNKYIYTYNRKGQLKSNSYGKAKRVQYYYSNGSYTKKTTRYYSSKGKLLKGTTQKRSSVSVATAKNIALSKTNGGVITSFETDYENGVKVYDIEIKKGNYDYDIMIKVSDGSIFKYDLEYDND